MSDTSRSHHRDASEPGPSRLRESEIHAPKVPGEIRAAQHAADERKTAGWRSDKEIAQAIEAKLNKQTSSHAKNPYLTADPSVFLTPPDRAIGSPTYTPDSPPPTTKPTSNRSKKRIRNHPSEADSELIKTITDKDIEDKAHTLIRGMIKSSSNIEVREFDAEKIKKIDEYTENAKNSLIKELYGKSYEDRENIIREHLKSGEKPNEIDRTKRLILIALVKSRATENLPPAKRIRRTTDTGTPVAGTSHEGRLYRHEPIMDRRGHAHPELRFRVARTAELNEPDKNESGFHFTFGEIQVHAPWRIKELDTNYYHQNKQLADLLNKYTSVDVTKEAVGLLLRTQSETSKRDLRPWSIEVIPQDPSSRPVEIRPTAPPRKSKAPSRRKASNESKVPSESKSSNRRKAPSDQEAPITSVAPTQHETQLGESSTSQLIDTQKDLDMETFLDKTTLGKKITAQEMLDAKKAHKYSEDAEAKVKYLHLYEKLKVLRDYSLQYSTTKEAEAIAAYKDIKDRYEKGGYDNTPQNEAKERCKKLGFPFAQ